MCSIGWVTIGADGAIACLIICRWTRCHRPSPHSIFFGRFRNLRVDDCRCRVALAPAGFAASLHERLMNTIEHAVARPFPENNYRPWCAEENLLAAAATGNPCDLHSGLR